MGWGTIIFPPIFDIFDNLFGSYNRSHLFLYSLVGPLLKGHISVNHIYRLNYISFEQYPISRKELKQEVKDVFDYIEDDFWVGKETILEYHVRGKHIEIYEPFKILNLVELIELYKFILDSGEDFDSQANSNKMFSSGLKDFVRVAIMDYLDIINPSDKFVLYLFLREFMEFQSDEVDREFYECGLLIGD